MTVQEIFNAMMAISDELSPSGTITASVNDYKYRVPAILNLLQSELLCQSNIYSEFEISHKPPNTSVGSYEILEFDNDDITIEAEGQVYGYYFEVDGQATVYIEDFTSDWNVLETITVYDTTVDFDSFKGLLTPTTGSTKTRIRFSGEYRYLIKNYALFKSKYPLSRLPDYRPWILKTMPSDFKSIDQIIEEYSTLYGKNTNYKFEGRNKIYINNSFTGSMRITYRPVPVALTSMSDSMEVDDVASRSLLIYGLGMELYKSENMELYQHFRSRYNELKIEQKVKQPASGDSLISYYGGFTDGGGGTW